MGSAFFDGLVFLHWLIFPFLRRDLRLVRVDVEDAVRVDAVSADCDFVGIFTAFFLWLMGGRLCYESCQSKKQVDQ